MVANYIVVSQVARACSKNRVVLWCKGYSDIVLSVPSFQLCIGKKPEKRLLSLRVLRLKRRDLFGGKVPSLSIFILLPS